MALSSFYEGDQDVGIEDDEIEASSGTDSSARPMQTPTSLFEHNHDESAKSKEKKDKTKNKYNVGGARIVTLNNMSSSDDDEDDESTGQVRYFFVYFFVLCVIAVFVK